MFSRLRRRANNFSGEIRAWPASRQVRNLSNSSASLSGTSAWPRARLTWALSIRSPFASSIVTWSYTEAPDTSGS